MLLSLVAFLLQPVDPSLEDAGTSAREFLDQHDAGGEEAGFNLLYLHGVSQGLSWANVAMEMDGKQPIYCPPENLTITVDQNVQILRDHTDNNPEIEDFPVALVFLLAVENVFPCEGSG
ncbi:Rap1a/Tai family immunity protein [Sphingomicrobium marinum]|uniref:Rap1a/Tai family immunity protein n=1 Tax=Sphingomicrobium marinum TaxID=1227950 RepID=UPI00223EA50E|nr:Rap1a/Tai family immunity protein [Sphingomicrobium marinum]